MHCSLSVSSDISSVGVDWEVVDFKLANWFLSCWNCSSRSPKGQQASVSSMYSSDESLSILAWGGPLVQDLSKVTLEKQGHPMCHEFSIWSPCHVSCGAFQKCLVEPSGVIVCGLVAHVYCGSGAG